MAFIFGSGMCFFQKMDVPYSSFAWKFTSCCWSILYIYIYIYIYIVCMSNKSHLKLAKLEAKATEGRGLQQQGTKPKTGGVLLLVWCISPPILLSRVLSKGLGLELLPRTAE